MIFNVGRYREAHAVGKAAFEEVVTNKHRQRVKTNWYDTDDEFPVTYEEKVSKNDSSIRFRTRSETSIADDLAEAEARQTTIVNNIIQVPQNVTVRKNESVAGKIISSDKNDQPRNKRLNTSPLVSASPKVQNTNKTPTQLRSGMEKFNISPIDDYEDFINNDDDDGWSKGKKVKKKTNNKKQNNKKQK